VEGRNGERFSNTILPFAWRQWEREWTRSSPGQYILPHDIKFSYSFTRPDSVVKNIQRTVLESPCIGWERIRNITSHYFLSHNLSFHRVKSICIECAILLQNNKYRYIWKCLKCVAAEGWNRCLIPIVREIKKYYIQSRRRGTSYKQ
jgi:hypothetical protein